MAQESTLHTNERSPNRDSRRIAGDPDLSASEAALECLKAYAKERPEVVALWAFGIGFVMGWKMKPW